MQGERHQRVAALFRAACELAPDRREAYLAGACDDDDLRAEVRELLERDARPHPGLAGVEGQRDRLIEEALQGARVASGAAASRPETIGPYRLIEKLGEGGMGEVWAAEQQQPVRRRVAVKLIKPGLDSAQVLARFEAERQALARMAHPSVAQVYDGGSTDDGRPYFVMEFVAGDSITQHCDRNRLPTRARIELFLQVCEGVQHAHQKGLIHRDLKPGNLLVMTLDGRAVPKIIDFGVARAATGRLVEQTLHTLVGQIVGTLDYMSPEQADPSGVDIDTRSDIYSLGVVLYQLLSGLLPFDHAAAVDRRLSEIQRVIREQPAPTPSTRLRRATATATAIAPLHGTDERVLARQLSGDLDWICLKALEKDPARRYASASELAQDLRRHLAHEPVLARRPGVRYRLGKFVRRNRFGVAAAVVVLAALATGAWAVVAGRVEAEAHLEQIGRLSDRPRIDQLFAEVEALWPATSDSLPALQDWVDRAHALLARRPLHRQTLDELTAARPEPASADEAAGPERQAALEQWRWQRGLQVDLLAALDELELLASEDVVSEQHGWSVGKRLAFVRDQQAGTPAGDALAAAWDEALPSLRASYGFELAPQEGLLPLGPDPVSQLWEFAHLATGVPAERDPDGRLRRGDETGLVLVLLPGGRSWVGAQGDDPGAPNFDPLAFPNEAPVHAVELSPFLASKDEMTQGQWQRLTGVSPNMYGADWGVEHPRSHPVENISWDQCVALFPRVGLALPSEAQWEYAARAGCQGSWSTGNAIESLHGAANLLSGGGNFGPSWPEDGMDPHVVVGQCAPNAFGLHDVHGNVLEWCQDGFVPDGFYGRSPEHDPVAPWERSNGRAYRGGGYGYPPVMARAATRRFSGPDFKGGAHGVRPIWPLVDGGPSPYSPKRRPRSR